MEFFEIIDWYRTIPMVLFLIIFARLFFIVTTILVDRINAEKFIWNKEINPEKLKIFAWLFLPASFFILYSYLPFFNSKFTFGLGSYFIIGTAGLAAVYLLIELIIRTPSKSYLNNSSVEIKDDKKHLVSSISNVGSINLLEVVSESDKSLSFTDNKYNNKNGIVEDDKVITQKETQLQNQNDTEIHDNIDVNYGIQEDNQSLNVQGTGRDLNKKPKQEGIQVNISSGKENGRVTSRVLRKSSDVVPDDITDEIIQEKMDLLKESYSLYCDIHDFASVLKKKEVNKKILFVNKDHKTVDFTKPEYLNLLNIIVDGNIGSHPNNKKVKEWIYFSFDNSNIREKIIGTEDISKLKNDLKKSNL